MNSVRKIFLSMIVFCASMSYFGCGKEEPVELSAQNMEVFAYDLTDAWEINASAIIKGVKHVEESGQFKYSLSFSADLVKPDSTKIENISTENLNGTSDEILLDIPIEVQFELSSAFPAGGYKLVLNVKDNGSGKNVIIEKEFELSGE